MTTEIVVSEAGILGGIGLLIGGIISILRQTERSRCKNINCCFGAIKCDRLPLDNETILELEEQTNNDDIKVNN